MIRRILYLTLGIIFIVVVVLLGLLSTSNSVFIVAFGIASAVLAPVGIGLVGDAFSSGDKELVARLARVPEIEILMQQAKSHEDKIRILENERAHLADIVQSEARRQSLLSRKKHLEQNAAQLLDELSAIDSEVAQIDTTVEQGTARDEIRQLQERIASREVGDIEITFLGISYRIHRDVFLGLFPLGSGRAVLAMMRIYQRYVGSKHFTRGRS